MTRLVVSEWSYGEQQACRHTMRFCCYRLSDGTEQVRRACSTCGIREPRSYPHRDHPHRERYPLIVEGGAPTLWDLESLGGAA
jgi:hypothetical protein